MEDSVIIEALKEHKVKPNHKSPLKPIDEIKIHVDKISVDVQSIKQDLRIIMDAINHQEAQASKGWWY